MGARKTPRPAAKASRDGRKAVAAARSGGRNSTIIWAGASVFVVVALLVVVIVSVTGNGDGRTSESDSATLDHPPATEAVGKRQQPAVAGTAATIDTWLEALAE